MGMVHADIELINGVDLGNAKRHIIGEDEIKRINVRALVDTGSYMLCINEKIKQQLQLDVVERKNAQLATGEIMEFDVVAPVEVRFKNRRTSCSAIVLPGDAEVLLGAIPMEDMPVKLPYIKLL